MKRIPVFIAVLCCSCGGDKSDYVKAENALDAGREFIESCSQGDFSKAAFYMLPDEKNTTMLAATERTYREKDKEGRQQLRLASINIAEIKQLTDSSTLIYYSSSADKQPKVLEVVKQNEGWLVNFANTYNPVR